MVLLELIDRVPLTVAEPGHQCLDWWCWDTGRTGLLSPTGWAAPPHRSLRPQSLSFGCIRSPRWRSRWGRLGGRGLDPSERGLLEPGSWDGRGSEVSSLRLFVQARDFLSLPPYCAKPALLGPIAVAAPGAFHGAETPLPTASGGASPLDTAACGRGRFPVCETAGK